MLTPVIALERERTSPLHTQIYRALRDAIVRGDLRGGMQMPSSRAMSADLRVSRITVMEAYAQLEAEGYLDARRGAGTFVSAALPESLLQTRHAANGTRASAGTRPSTPVRGPSGPRPVSRRVQGLPKESMAPWVTGMGAFAVHQPAFDAFPFAVWSRLVTEHARNPTMRAIHHVDPLGLPRFREAICEYLRTARAVECEPDEVMIVSGSQQALQIAATVLLDPGAPVWMEEPGYRLARLVFAAAGARTIPVPVDEDGMDVAEGRRLCDGAALAYVSPSHQYPLGSTMSAARRMQLLHWAQERGAWIIEDDYDSEYRFESAPVASMQGLDRNARVIYIGTFSKVLFASLRVGYIVVPRDLIERFVAVRTVMDIFPPYLYQEVITDFMREGHFARHIRRMRQLYSDRRAALVELLANTFGDGLEVHGAEAGMHLAVTFPEARDDQAIADRAAADGLWLWPLSRSYMTRATRTGFVLGYGNVAVETMPGAMRKMKAALGRFV